MAERHRQNEQQFRTQVICNGYLLSKDIERWSKTDEIRDQHLKNFVHKEQLKKLNRDRILKILNYESENFWFNEQNLEERLVDTTIFPEEVGSTEYYHKLTEQSLAYENLDF
jgi:predicted ATPase with chaperone activity